MGKSQSKISKEDMDFLQQKTDLDKSTIEVRHIIRFHDLQKCFLCKNMIVCETTNPSLVLPFRQLC